MIGHEIQLAGDFDAAIETVTQALADQGFGVITRIDLDKTFAEKLGVDFRRYTILGACNPKLAHRAVSDAPAVGLLLPCNVTVEGSGSGDGVLVRLPDAAAALGGAGLAKSAALDVLAEDAGERLARVAEALGS